MLYTAEQIYEKLVDDYKIKEVNGFIRFNLGPHEIIVITKDVVGSIIENWVKDWMKANDIDFEPNPNTQEKPDIYIYPADKTQGLLEIKAFDYTKSPNFDIADFKAFAKELLRRPYLIDTKALIFGYTMNIETGEVIVKDLWLMNIWELSRPSKRWPINVQYKNGIISKIRPATWYSYSKKLSFKAFKKATDFLAAFEETLFRYPDTHTLAVDWKKKYKKAYKEHYNTSIDFPRWDDIKEDYGFKD